MCNGKRPADIQAGGAGGGGAAGGAGGGAAVAPAVPKPVEPAKPKIVDGVLCQICFDEYPKADVFDADCKHTFCKGCWKDYLNDKVKDGKTIKIRCPDPKCKREVTEQVLCFIGWHRF